MNDDTGLAAALGVQPQIDVIERMATLQSSKSQGVLKLLTVLKKTGQITHKNCPPFCLCGVRVSFPAA